MQHLPLLTTLFESVLVCAEDGTVMQRYGQSLDIKNVLQDDRLIGLSNLFRECLAGSDFETYFSLDQRERTRWRGVPYATEEGKTAVVIGIESPPRHSAPRIRQSAGEYEFVIANMRQGFWRRNAKDAIIFANEYLANWLETTIDDMVGRHITEFIPLYEGRSGRFEAEFVTKTGIRRRAIVASAPLFGPKGRSSGHIDVITDITAEHALRTRLVAEVQKMSRLAMTDTLTGLANRAEFVGELERLTGQDPIEPFALVMIDLDRFKEVNDQHGHVVGDHVLIEFAARLRVAVRESDLVSRLGGDEFAILLEKAPREIALEVVERLADRLSFQVTVGKSEVQVGASIGWAHSDDGVANVLQSADRRMYRDKRKKKGA
ncbi:MAG: hypothetical protein BGO01_09695 [Armatimonadetes bacterium 55-13]|nr:sensor domain-containing diguanylate cyclase [Armatimonadota bacterium]OJU62678.1 MAG: hypothetical protein BGO01_09695 [Armatimonadetes bacterium 55-13]